MAGVQGPRHGLLPSAFARDRAGFARRHHGRLCRELAGCHEVFRRRLRSLHRPSTPASYTSSLDPHDEFDRALVRRRTSADEDRAECFRREARPEADVRRAHPRCRKLARLALHRIRTASARRREKRSGRRIRGLYHPIRQAISAASFQQFRALTDTKIGGWSVVYREVGNLSGCLATAQFPDQTIFQMALIQTGTDKGWVIFISNPRWSGWIGKSKQHRLSLVTDWPTTKPWQYTFSTSGDSKTLSTTDASVEFMNSVADASKVEIKYDNGALLTTVDMKDSAAAI